MNERTNERMDEETSSPNLPPRLKHHPPWHRLSACLPDSGFDPLPNNFVLDKRL